jgi:hypothetical protein
MRMSAVAVQNNGWFSHRAELSRTDAFFWALIILGLVRTNAIRGLATGVAAPRGFPRISIPPYESRRCAPIRVDPESIARP